MKKRKAKITNIRNKKGNVIQTLQTLIERNVFWEIREINPLLTQKIGRAHV